MQKEYISLGLMSGTSGDGVDASLIRSDGITNYEVLKAMAKLSLIKLILNMIRIFLRTFTN